MRAVALLVLIPILTSCGFSGPLRVIPAPWEGAVIITTVRPSHFVVGAVSYIVAVDGIDMFAMRSGDHATMPVPPGEHIVAVKCNCGWTGTGMNAIRLVTEPGGRYYLAVGPNVVFAEPPIVIDRVSEEVAKEMMRETSPLILIQ